MSYNMESCMSYRLAYPMSDDMGNRVAFGGKPYIFWCGKLYVLREGKEPHCNSPQGRSATEVELLNCRHIVKP